MRIDQYMAQWWPEYSRSTWQKFIALGLVQVNGQVVASAHQQLGEDDIVTHLPLPQVDDTTIILPVVYEDKHVIVINKPAGILTHAKGSFAEEFTVADFVRGKMNEVEDTNRPGIVHRLDRQTSGIMIAAKDSPTKHSLQKQFQDRKAKKTYIAIIRGIPKHHEANIDIPIGRNPKTPSTFRVDAQGKPAQTHYEVLATKGGLSVVRLKPVTGRTHQLRVHLRHIGTPIVGDTAYGGGDSPIHRLCLHAEQLEITIPQGDRKTFVAPLPDDFQELVDDICA